MTTDVVDGTRNKKYKDQKIEIMNLAKRSQVPYEIPTTLQAITCIFAEYFRSKTRLFSDKPLTYTRCQEKVDGFYLNIGRFTSYGPYVCSNYPGNTDGSHCGHNWRCGLAEVLRLLVLGC